MLHDLEYRWTLSYKPKITYKQQQTERDWLLDYKNICVIKDIETFWGVYNNIPDFTDMPSGSIYAMFKEGISPSWEHEQNKNGFSWILYGSRNATKAWIHNVYESVMLMLIGCQYKYESALNGCSFERKTKGDKIVFWFKGIYKDNENNDNETNENIMLDELFKEIEMQSADYILCADEMKIDWKLPEYKHKKVCVKLVQHLTTTETKTDTKNDSKNDSKNDTLLQQPPQTQQPFLQQQQQQQQPHQHIKKQPYKSHHNRNYNNKK